MTLKPAWLLLLCLAPALANASKMSPDSLLTLEAERLRLIVARDTIGLERLLADELTYCHSNGICETKSEFLEALSKGSTRYLKIELLHARVRRHGDIAILNGQIRVDAEMRGNVIQGAVLSYTDVYRRERGAWRLIAWHSSRRP